MRCRSLTCMAVLPIILSAFLDRLPSLAQAPARQSNNWAVPPDLQTSLRSGLLGNPLSDAEYDEAGFHVDQFDLNRDGRPESFVVGYCSPTGNCDLWIIEKTRTEFRILLTTDLAHVVCVRSTKNRGFSDVEKRSHGSAFDSRVTVFRYDGEQYQPAEGYNLRWKYDEATGKTRQVEGPTAMPKCHEVFARPRVSSSH